MPASRRLTGLALIATVGLLASACSTPAATAPQYSPGFADCAAKPNTCNSGPTAPGGTLTLALEKTIPNFNVWDGSGNTYETGQVMSGLLPSAFTINPDGTVTLNANLLVSADITSQSPLTVTYRIQPGAIWSDGVSINADDFTYAYKIRNGTDCKDCPVAGTTGYSQVQSVTGSDGGKTVTVVYKSPYADWKGLFTGNNALYPAHIAAKAGDLTTAAGLKASYTAFIKDTPTWSGGPYLISNYDKDVAVTETPNPKWYGSIKPSLDRVVFKIIEDQAQEVPALQNNEVQALIAQPNADIVSAVKGDQNVNYNLTKGPTWEHIDLNFKNRWLADPALRKAIFTAIDRKAIIAKTVGPFFAGAAPLNNHNIMPGQPGYKDVVTATGQGAGNVEAAKKILTDAGYTISGTTLKTKAGETVPPLRFGFTNGNALREATGEVVQNELAQIGLQVTLNPFKSLGGTLASGDFDMIIFAWVGSPFLLGAANQWSSTGGSDYNHYSNPQVDQIFAQVKTTIDYNTVYDLLNQADAIMAADASVLPLYQKPVFLAVDNKFVNIRNNANLSGPAYNIQEWGQKSSSVK
jgi:peptide/nickel transport system substrate-binding protein